MKIIADLHTHTVASGHAYSTITEMAYGAAERNMKILAMTDHGPKIPGGPHYYHFGNLKAVPDYIAGVRILKGAEANVIDWDGSLDLDGKHLECLEIVLIGLHSHCTPNGSVEENTDMLIRAMRNPAVDIVAHAGNPEYKINYQRFVAAAVENDVAIEVNESSLTLTRLGSDANCKEIIALAKEQGAKITLGSDSHYFDRIGCFNAGVELLRECDFPLERVLNYSEEDIFAHLARKRGGR